MGKKFIDHTPKTCILFWGAIPVVLVLGFASPDAVFDINIHDTYFVIQHKHLAELIAC